MPTPYLKKLSKEGKGSLSELEKKWAKAKAIANSEGKGKDWGLIVSIFKKIINESDESNESKRKTFKDIFLEGNSQTLKWLKNNKGIRDEIKILKDKMKSAKDDESIHLMKAIKWLEGKL